MSKSKDRFFPIILTLIIIMIIIYLFMTIKQPYVECSKSSNDNLDITVREDLVTKFAGNKISSMKLVKTIILPSEYATDKHVESIKFSLESALEYLDKEKVKYTVLDDRLIVEINVNSNETIILNNIEFKENNGLQVKVNSNTKSSEVVTLKVGDNYTEGELMKRLRNNGYVCK